MCPLLETSLQSKLIALDSRQTQFVWFATLRSGLLFSFVSVISPGAVTGGGVQSTNTCDLSAGMLRRDLATTQHSSPVTADLKVTSSLRLCIKEYKKSVSPWVNWSKTQLTSFSCCSAMISHFSRGLYPFFPFHILLNKECVWYGYLLLSLS